MRPWKLIRTVSRSLVIAVSCLGCWLGTGVLAAGPTAQATPIRRAQLESVDYYRDAPTALTRGADGNVWFVAGSSVGRLTPDGAVTSYLLDWRAETSDLVAEAGGIWFTDRHSIGRLSYSGELTTYGWGLTADPTQLAIAPDGTVWFAGDRGRVGTISQSGDTAEYLIATREGTPYLETTDLAVAGDGTPWLALTEAGADADHLFVSLVRLTAGGATLAQLPRLPAEPGRDAGYRYRSLVRGPDGAVWYSRTYNLSQQRVTGIVGRLVDSAPGQSWSLPAIGQLAVGADDALWFSLAQWIREEDPTLGRLTTTGESTTYDVTTVANDRRSGGALIGGPQDRIWGATGVGIANLTTAGTAGTTFDAPVEMPYWPWITALDTSVSLGWPPFAPPPGQLDATSYALEVQPGDQHLSSGVESAEVSGLEPGRSYRLQVRGRAGDLVGLPRTSILTTQPQRAAGPAADFTGDGRADVAVWRPSSGAWYVKGRAAVVYGRAGDIPVPADYTGDGKTDLAVFRPSTGTWFVKGRASVVYGRTGDIPVPGNFLGDRRADLVVWRPSTGVWFRRGAASVRYGARGDRPLILDRNGDGRNEIAVYSPEDDTWSVLDVGFWPGRNNKGLPIPGAFDSRRGDDLVTFCPWNGSWEIGTEFVTYGVNGDIPV